MTVAVAASWVIMFALILPSLSLLYVNGGGGREWRDKGGKDKKAVVWKMRRAGEGGAQGREGGLLRYFSLL